MTIILFSIMWKYSFPQTDEFAALRNNMVRYQISGRGIKNNEILKAMRKVPLYLIIK
jgi:hypothetical protein